MEISAERTPSAPVDQFNDALTDFVSRSSASNESTVKLFKLLAKIVLNVLEHPDDPQYRAINAKSKAVAELIHLKPANALLYALGFALRESHYELAKVDRELLQFAAQRLLQLVEFKERARNVRESSELFQPHVTNLLPPEHTLRPTPKERADYDHTRIKELLEHEHLRREFAAWETALDLQYEFHVASSATAALSESDEDEQMYALDNLKLQNEALLHKMRNVLKFQNSAKQQLLRVQNEPNYEVANVKVFAPDNSFVKFQVKPSFTGRQLTDLVMTRFLHPSVARTQSVVSLKTGPPYVDIPENYSLYRAKLTPNCCLRLVFEPKVVATQYFNKTLID